jgi:hypothetical protein
MPEIDRGAKPAKPAATSVTAEPASSGGWTGYGIGAAALGALAVAAVALVGVLWSGHRTAAAERDYQARVMQTATEWTSQLINMNAGNVENTLGQLREKTVGELNTEFNSAIAPYRDVIKTLRTRSNGQVQSVAIEALHNDLPPQPGQRPPSPPTLPLQLADRTDTVLVVGTSVSENTEKKPVNVNWILRLGVSDVDGNLMISRLESVR